MNTRLAVCVVGWGVLCQVARAQLVTETIDLSAGWNAVWVNLEPEPNALDLILAAQTPALDYQSIWTLEQGTSAASPAASGSPGRWLFHDRDVPVNISTLRSLPGHRGYLIQMRSPGQLQLSGQPLIRSTFFSSQRSSMFGVLTDLVAGNFSFENYFSHPKSAGKIRTSGSPALHDIFALSANTYVRKSLLDDIESNTAYWVNVTQDFDYAGLVDVSSTPNGLAFGRNTSQRTLRIEVSSSPSVRTLHVQARDCAVLSETGACSGTGAAVDWLEYRDPTQSGVPVWQPLSAGLTLQVPPGVTQVEVELRARRNQLAGNLRSRGGGGSLETFPALIDVTDANGSRTVLSASVTVQPVFGTWIGRAALTRVSVHPALQSLPLDQSQAPPLGMTLLLELPDPAAGGGAPQLLDSLSVSSFRDGRQLTRVFNSILFDRPVPLIGDVNDPLDPLGATGTLTGSLHIASEDPLNPYRHRYHPEHRKGYDITRDITIRLQPAPPSPADILAGLDGTFGPDRLNGEYTEVITGISALPITVQGTFQLERLETGSSAVAGR